MIKTLTKEQLAKTIDQTLLSPTATFKDIDKLCIDAKKYHFAAVCINPSFIVNARKILAGTDVKICSVVGYPLGANSIETKVFEARDNVRKGADELDMVINLGMLKSKDYFYIEKEIRTVVNIIRREQMAEYNKNINIKIIIETGILTKEEVKRICVIGEESGADFIKTSTGKTKPAATLEAAYIMTQAIAEYFQKSGRMVGFKPAGGISTGIDAVNYLAIVKHNLGDSWFVPKYFRIGASSLANNILSEINTIKKVENPEVNYF